MIPRGLFSNDWQGGLAVTVANSRSAQAMTGHWGTRGTPWRAAFDGVYAATLRVHPQTQAVAYVARQGQTQVVVQNRQVSGGYDAVWFDSLRFTPNGDAVFFLAERGGHTVFVVNGATQREFDMALQVQPHQLNPEGMACGLDVAAVNAGEIDWLTLMPQTPRFGLGRG